MIHILLETTLLANNWMGEAVRLVSVLLAFLLYFALAELGRYFWNPPTEWTRKFVHVASGITIACFHWIFTSIWSVILLVILFGAAMAIVRKLKLFPSIYAIERSSLGDIYFLVSAFFLFLISYDRPILYFISILTLTVSDALAAVLGSTYQKTTYTVESQRKSLEGSMVFFLSTFLIVHIPLLLMTDIGRLECMMIALQVALVVTCLEAICINGFDNIMIPIGTYYLLFKLMPSNAPDIAWQISWQFVILATLYYISLRFSFLSFSGAIVIQLFLSGAFIFGGPTWIVAPLMCLGPFIIAQAVLSAPTKELPLHRVYQVVATFYVCLVPALLFFAHNTSDKYIRPEFHVKNISFFYVLFLGALAAHLTIALYRLLGYYSLRLRFKYLGLLCIALICYCFLVPFGLWLQMGFIRAIDLFITLLIVIVAYHVFYFGFRHSPLLKEFPWEFRIQALSVFCGVCLALPIYYMLI